MLPYATAVLVVASLLASVQVQAWFAFTFDPESVSPKERDGWCTEAQETCSTLCQGFSTKNDCAVESLVQQCECSFYKSPDLTLYTGTVQSLKCQRAYTDCVNGNPSNGPAQTRCKSDIMDTCPVLDPQEYQPPIRVPSSPTKPPAPQATAAKDATPTPTPTPTSETVDSVPVELSTSKTSSPPSSTLSTGASSPSTTVVTTSPSATRGPTSSQPSTSTLGEAPSPASQAGGPLATSPARATPTARPTKTAAVSVGAWVGMSVGIGAALLSGGVLGLWLRRRQQLAEESPMAEAERARSSRSNRGSVIVVAGRNHGLDGPAGRGAEEKAPGGTGVGEGEGEGWRAAAYGHARPAAVGESRRLRPAASELA